MLDKEVSLGGDVFQYKRSGRLQTGATLIEMLLVFALIGSLTMLSVRMYLGFQSTFEMKQLQDKTNQLFQAGSNYYFANCETGNFSPNPPSAAGITYPPTAPRRVSVSTLTGGGYLANWSPNSNLIDNTAVDSDAGYIVQLNPRIIQTTTSPITLTACNITTPGTACTPSTTPLANSGVVIVSWDIQVAVKVNNASKANALKVVLAADCLSGKTGSGASAIVSTCTAPDAAQNYLVWSRSASAAYMDRLLWPSMSGVQQLKLQYTHDPNYELNSSPSPTIYYLCGG